MIIVRLDYSIGNEISYEEGIEKREGFATHCLDFFSTDTVSKVMVMKKDGSYIDRDGLLSDSSPYTAKKIRCSHNLVRLLKAGVFVFRGPNEDMITNGIA